MHGKIVGSYLVIQADTMEQVWDSLKKDIFYSSGEVVSGLYQVSPERRVDADDMTIPGVYVYSGIMRGSR